MPITVRQAISTIVLLGASFFGGCGHRNWDQDAVDYSPRLTRIASRAKPFIEALDRYAKDHQKAPDKLDELEPYVTDEAGKKAISSNAIGGWSYIEPGWDSVHDKKSAAAYTLSYKLDWDPQLYFRFDGKEGIWEFDPGDGSPSRKLQLKP